MLHLLFLGLHAAALTAHSQYAHMDKPVYLRHVLPEPLLPRLEMIEGNSKNYMLWSQMEAVPETEADEMSGYSLTRETIY